MSMDDLRKIARQQENELLRSSDVVIPREIGSDKLFGMTPVERMFISIGCFLVTGMAGFLILLVLDKIAL